MVFWEHVYELRRKGLIPREWKCAHLERYLEKPQGPFQRTTIMTVDSTGRRNTPTVRGCDGNTETSSVISCGTSSDAVAGSSHGGTS